MYSKILLVVLLVLCLATMSCRKLEVADMDVEEGDLKIVKTEIADGIAESLGKFVAVTPHPNNGNWAALWFEEENGTISVVWVNVLKRRVMDNVLTIPRK